MLLSPLGSRHSIGVASPQGARYNGVSRSSAESRRRTVNGTNRKRNAEKTRHQVAQPAKEVAEGETPGSARQEEVTRPQNEDDDDDRRIDAPATRPDDYRVLDFAGDLRC